MILIKNVDILLTKRDTKYKWKSDLQKLSVLENGCITLETVLKNILTTKTGVIKQNSETIEPQTVS